MCIPLMNFIKDVPTVEHLGVIQLGYISLRSRRAGIYECGNAD